MKAWYTNKYLHMATSVVAEKISMSTVVLVQIAGELMTDLLQPDAHTDACINFIFQLLDSIM